MNPRVGKGVKFLPFEGRVCCFRSAFLLGKLPLTAKIGAPSEALSVERLLPIKIEQYPSDLVEKGEIPFQAEILEGFGSVGIPALYSPSEDTQSIATESPVSAIHDLITSRNYRLTNRTLLPSSHGRPTDKSSVADVPIL